MCGRFQLKPTKKIEKMINALGAQGELIFSDDQAPGSKISIIHGRDRRIDPAIWWLLLDLATGKPNHKYASFNSRWNKLNQPRSIAYQPYRHSRCLIPATAFAEGLGDRKTYHKIKLEDMAIAFGGLYKESVIKDTGEVVRSASIITLPPVDKWRTIHPKSIPLMLDWQDEELMEKWLDPDFQDIKHFQDLIEPRVPFPQIVTPIDKPSSWKPIGDPFRIN